MIRYEAIDQGWQESGERKRLSSVCGCEVVYSGLETKKPLLQCTTKVLFVSR
jgi:hypothetical protein